MRAWAFPIHSSREFPRNNRKHCPPGSSYQAFISVPKAASDTTFESGHLVYYSQKNEGSGIAWDIMKLTTILWSLWEGQEGAPGGALNRGRAGGG